ncbi:MAG TPA: FmdB family zinc ribbon protein [Nitrospira sp.]|nr:FmdB family zinc ribbon protein [Nitrospira sp.]
MPIYEYLCEGCSYKFEVKQSIKDEPLAVCDRCGNAVKRLISSPAIMFKGSGWYVTDYSDKLKPPSNGDSAPAGTGEKKDAASGTQPASTPAASASTTTAPASTSGTAAPASTPPAPAQPAK